MTEIIGDLNAFLRYTLTLLDDVNQKEKSSLLGGAIVSALIDIAQSQRRQAKAQEDIAEHLLNLESTIRNKS